MYGVGAFFGFALVVMIAIALWRGMNALESIDRSLERIADVLEQERTS